MGPYITKERASANFRIQEKLAQAMQLAEQTKRKNLIPAFKQGYPDIYFHELSSKQTKQLVKLGKEEKIKGGYLHLGRDSFVKDELNDELGIVVPKHIEHLILSTRYKGLETAILIHEMGHAFQAMEKFEETVWIYPNKLPVLGETEHLEEQGYIFGTAVLEWENVHNLMEAWLRESKKGLTPDEIDYNAKYIINHRNNLPFIRKLQGTKGVELPALGIEKDW